MSDSVLFDSMPVDTPRRRRTIIASRQFASPLSGRVPDARRAEMASNAAKDRTPLDYGLRQRHTQASGLECNGTLALRSFSRHFLTLEFTNELLPAQFN